MLNYYCLKIMLCSVFLIVAVIIGFEQDRYSVNEDDGSLQACITIVGPPGVAVPVNVTAQSGSAQGAHSFCVLICSIRNFKLCLASKIV